MKIGILTLFNSYDPGYALHGSWLEKARILQYYGVDFDFITCDVYKGNYYPQVRPVINQLPKEASFEEKVAHYEEQLEKLVPDYDVIFTADIMYLNKTEYLALNQAIRNVAPAHVCRWYHWVHSGFNLPSSEPDYPSNLRFSLPPRSKMVYQNTSEADGLAKMYNTTMDNIRIVPATKDMCSFRYFHPLSQIIVRSLDLYNKDFVQVLPFSSTRTDAKGIDFTVRVFSSLKKRGNSVALVLANAHSRKAEGVILQKKYRYPRFGLVYGKDLLFTSDLTGDNSLPALAVADLFTVSNLFVYASFRENCPQALLEAKLTGNLLVLNENTAPLREFGGENAIYFRSSYKIPGMPDSHDGSDSRIIEHRDEFFDGLAARIEDEMRKQGKIYRSQREAMKQFSYETIWEKYLNPIIEERW